MSGMPHPWQVRVETGTGRVLTGCGGDPASLLAGEWRLVAAGGSALPEGGTIRLDGGQVSGRAVCNRFTGGYDLTGEGLRFTPLAATKMACPGEGMQAEASIFAALAAVDRFDLDDGGRLVLIGGDVSLLEATR